MFNVGWYKDGCPSTNYFLNPVQFHQTLSFQHIIDLFFGIVFVFGHKSFGLVGGEAEVKVLGTGIRGRDEHF